MLKVFKLFSRIALGGFVGLVALGVVSKLVSVAHQRQIELEIRNRTAIIQMVVAEGGGGCTGTLLSHNYVLTNAHCIMKGLENIYVRRINDKEYMEAVVVSSAPVSDYALLQFKGLDTSTQVDFTSDWHLGEEIILYGNPGNINFVIGHSRIISYVYIMSPMKKVRTMFVYPCDTQGPGSSGSGIYNLQGSYIGTHELGQEIPILMEIAERLAGHPVHGPLCFAIPAKEAMMRNLDRPWRGFDLSENEADRVKETELNKVEAKEEKERAAHKRETSYKIILEKN